MTLPSTVQPSEITALLVAIPIFLLWVRNYLDAWKGIRAVRQIAARGGNGVFWQAVDVIFSAFTMAVIELVIIGILVMMMTFNPNPDSTLLSRWAIAGGTIVVSLLVGAIALVRKITGDRTLARARGSERPTPSESGPSDRSEAE